MADYNFQIIITEKTVGSVTVSASTLTEAQEDANDVIATYISGGSHGITFNETSTTFHAVHDPA